MASLFGSQSIASLLCPDSSDTSSLTEHAFASDKHLRSFDDTLFAAKLLTIRTQPD